MILSSNEIRKFITKSDDSMIQPFSEEQLQGASYDVSMSGAIAVLKETGGIIDPNVPVDENALYEKITIGKDGYLLSPGNFVLVALNEKINLPNNVIVVKSYNELSFYSIFSPNNLKGLPFNMPSNIPPTDKSPTTISSEVSSTN